MIKKSQDVVPHLCVKDGKAAVAFYEKALGATDAVVHTMPNGKVMHAEFRVGDSLIMLAEEFPEMGSALRSPQTLSGTACSLQVSVPDTDAAFKHATEAGAKPLMPPTDMFWGDRYSMLQDPFGHIWALRTTKEELTPAQLEERTKAFFATGK
jgi:PhnB protein